VSLYAFLRQVVFDRSLAGWRTVRPGVREGVVVALWMLVLIYAVAVLISTASGAHCFPNPDTDSCNGWINH
jgi:hypothetical protein